MYTEVRFFVQIAMRLRYDKTYLESDAIYTNTISWKKLLSDMTKIHEDI